MGGLTNFPNGISSQGVPVLGVTTGNVFFVHRASGNAGNGRSANKPFRAINTAIAACKANNGDVIIAMPGHYEDLGDTSTTGAIDLDVAGISLVGIGTGSDQPRIDFNDADSDFIIGANDVRVEGMHLRATVTGVKLGIAIETLNTGTIIKNNRFTSETANTDEFLIPINLTVGCDNTTITGNKIDMTLGGATEAIAMVGASSGIIITDNDIVGDYSLACISVITTLCTDIRIERNLLVNGNANALGAVAALDFITGCLGIVRDNTIFSDVATFLLMTVADTMLYSNNNCSDDSGAGTTTALVSATVVAATDG